MSIALAVCVAAVLFSPQAHVVDAQTASCTCDTPGNRQLMMRLYTATKSKWQNPTVTTSNPICSWASSNKMIVCNGSFVSQLDLQNRNLQGDISAFSFRNLSDLRLLDLSGNSVLTGAIENTSLPTSIETVRLPSGCFGELMTSNNLPNIMEWSCPGCGFTGTLPGSWCRAENGFKLRVVDISGNHAVSGTLPPSWSNCSMALVDASDTNISGTIPPQWMSSTSALPAAIETIALSRARLSGAAPWQWLTVAVPHLIILRASGNFFTGTMPTAITAPLLSIVELAQNLMSGSLPSALGSSLKVLDVSHNRLEGLLPALLPPNMLSVDLSDNVGLTGPFPSAWGNDSSPFARTIASLKLGGCNFSGTIPEAWLSSSKLESLQELNVSRNVLSGTLPSSISTPFLRIIDVSSNMLSGPFPAHLVNATTLTVIHASHNAFSGNLPDRLPPSMEVFDASHNNLRGSIPSWRTKASLVNLSWNALTGSIPSTTDWFAGVIGGRVVDVSQNQLTGSLPNDIAVNVSTLIASSNKITLPLPRQQTAKDFLTFLDVRNNSLAGMIVANTRFSRLQHLDISNNRVTGFGVSETGLQQTMPKLKELWMSNNRVSSLPSLLPDTLEVFDISHNLISGNLPGLWTWVYALRDVNVSFNNMDSTGIPKELCRRLIGSQDIVISGAANAFEYRQIAVDLLGATVRLRDGNTRVTLSTKEAAQDWMSSSCWSWSSSLVATVSRLVTVTDTPLPSPSPSVRRVSVTLSPTVGNITRTISRTRGTASARATLSPAPSRSPSRTSTRRTMLLSDSCSLAPTRTPVHTSSLSLVHTQSPNSASPSRTWSIGDATHSRSLSRSSSTYCGNITGVVTSGRTGGLYNVFQGNPLFIGMTWSGGALDNFVVASVTTSWGFAALKRGPTTPQPDDVNISSTPASADIVLELSTAPIVKDLSADILVELTVGVTWRPHAGFTCSATAANVPVMLEASAPPTPPELREGSSIAAVALAGPLAAAASTLQVSLLQLQLSNCEFSDAAPLSIAESPTRLMIGPSLGAAFRGAIVGNIALVCVGFLLGWLLALCHHVASSTESIFFSQAKLRLPGRCLVLVSLLLQPTVMSGVALLRMPTAEPADYALGVAAFAPFLVIIVCIHRYTSAFILLLAAKYDAPIGVLDFLVGRRLHWIPRRLGHSSGWRALLIQFGVRLDRGAKRSGDGTTSSDDDDDDEPSGSPRDAFLQSQRYDYIIGRQAPQRERFFLVDFAVSGLYGVVGGMRPRTEEGCTRAQAALIAIAVVYLGLLLVLRPYAARTDGNFFALMALMSVISSGLMVAGLGQSSDILSFVQMGTLLMRSALLATYVVFNKVTRIHQRIVAGKEPSPGDVAAMLDDRCVPADVPAIPLEALTAEVEEMNGNDASNPQESARDSVLLFSEPLTSAPQAAVPAARTEATIAKGVREMCVEEIISAILAYELSTAGQDRMMTVEELHAPPSNFSRRIRLKNAVLLAARGDRGGSIEANSKHGPHLTTVPSPSLGR